ncbi:MAG: SDR family NAD(P)-dependent oxidoreductase [Thermoguttaceae bacterium]|jgi:short-subunit dehydrogenase
MARRKIRDMRTIVTGASSGIGRELARELGRQGAKLVLVARRQQRLQELAAEIAPAGEKGDSPHLPERPGGCFAQMGTVPFCPPEIVAGDITDPGVRQAAVYRAERRYGGLDALVNNAGIGALGRFEDANPQRVRRVMEVNFFAALEMARLAFPLLKVGNRPILVNVASILGHRAAPFSSEYAASKFALRGFSEALRAEWTRHGIDVLVVSPGRTETEFFEQVIEQTGAPDWPALTAASPAAVARQIVRAMRRGRHEIIPHRWGRALVWLNRLCPRLVDAIMSRYA